MGSFREKGNGTIRRQLRHTPGPLPDFRNLTKSLRSWYKTLFEQ